MLRVVVLDVNDNPPTFERTSYYTTISEAAQVATVVARVRATSLDIGANAAITYTIAAGNQQGKFAIGAKDGEREIFSAHEIEKPGNAMVAKSKAASTGMF